MASAATTVSAASFQIQGADGTPVLVPAGQFYFNTKARAKRMTENSSLSAADRQVYACMELGTMGFQQELCVTMERGERRPMTPADISRQTGLSRQNVRRAIENLEREGLAQRSAADGGALRAGQVLIYSWAIPRPPAEPRCSRGGLHFPEWFPESWESLKPAIKRLKLLDKLQSVVADDYTLREGDAAAEKLAEAERVVTEFVMKVCGRLPLYKEERTERTEEKERDSSSSSSATIVALPPEETTTTTTEPEPPWTEPEPEPPPDDPDSVMKAALNYHHFQLSRPAARDIVHSCQKKLPELGVTPDEVARFVYCVAPIRPDGGVRNPPGFLKRAVVNAITAEEVKCLRDTARPQPATDLHSEPELDDDREVERNICRKCGGYTTLYSSGQVSWCRCEAEKRARGGADQSSFPGTYTPPSGSG